MKIIGIVGALLITIIIAGIIFLEIGSVTVDQTQITKEIPLAGGQS
ncbi:MAG: hypothetical protein WC043_00125 [Pseudobdellovibrionaceae bacterium]